MQVSLAYISKFGFDVFNILCVCFFIFWVFFKVNSGGFLHNGVATLVVWLGMTVQGCHLAVQEACISYCSSLTAPNAHCGVLIILKKARRLSWCHLLIGQEDRKQLMHFSHTLEYIVVICCETFVSKAFLMNLLLHL